MLKKGWQDKFKIDVLLFAICIGISIGIGIGISIILGFCKWSGLSDSVTEICAVITAIGVIAAIIFGYKQFRHQKFESSFFQLLGLHNDIVNSMELAQSNNDKFLRRECFKHMTKRFKSCYTKQGLANEAALEAALDIAEKKKQSVLNKINNKYEKFLKKYQGCVGHYFRHLYNIVKFVDEDGPRGRKKKKRYTNLVRAQLSSYELALLFYNCLSVRGKNFKCLVEKYALLKDMDFTLLVHPVHKKLYQNDAYEESDSQ